MTGTYVPPDSSLKHQRAADALHGRSADGQIQTIIDRLVELGPALDPKVRSTICGLLGLL